MSHFVGHMVPGGPRPPTVREMEALACVVTCHGYAPAAQALGLTLDGLRMRMRALYVRLGVTSLTEALIAVGWLTVPEEYAA